LKNVNIRFPAGVHEALINYRDTRKPHMSINALVVDAVSELVEEQERRRENIEAGRTQISPEFVSRKSEA